MSIKKVILSAGEAKMCKEIATRISEFNGVMGEGNFSTGHNPDFLGECGEYAFAQYYGLEPNTEVLESGDTSDYEIICKPSGERATVDVKTISYENGDMLIQNSRELKSDLYFLVEARGDTYYIIGYVRRSTAEEAGVYPPGEYSPVSVKRIPRSELQEPPGGNRVMEPRLTSERGSENGVV